MKNWDKFRSRLWILALLLAASFVQAEDAPKQFGIDNLLQGAPNLANSIRPSGNAGLTDSDLDTPARRQARLQSAPAASSPGENKVDPPIDWHSIVQSALSGSVKQAPVVQTPPKKDAALDEPRVRALTARDRLLSSISLSLPAKAPQEKLAPVVSDLGVFRARGLASDTNLPGSTADMTRHNVNVGRHISTAPNQGYTQPE